MTHDFFRSESSKEHAQRFFSTIMHLNLEYKQLLYSRKKSKEVRNIFTEVDVLLLKIAWVSEDQSIISEMGPFVKNLDFFKLDFRIVSPQVGPIIVELLYYSACLCVELNDFGYAFSLSQKVCDLF